MTLLSFVRAGQRHRRAANEGSQDINPPPRGVRHRSSFDTFVVAHRTRIPSNQVQPPQPTEVDLRVATSLLDRSHAQSKVVEPSFLTVEAIPGCENQSTAHAFTERYNDAARELGLSELSILSDGKSSGIEPDETLKHTPKSWLSQRLSRRSSVGSLILRHSRSERRQSSLDAICRIGGFSILQLPAKYASSALVIPSCLAATGNFLIKHGKGTPGIFRIPGQTSVVNALYAYYNNQMWAAEEADNDIHITVGSCELPAGMLVDTHDVASVFKRFLRDLPGGILGSLELFKAFKEIRDMCTPLRALTIPKLVALRLLTLDSENRLAVIRAVFGLLAYLKQNASTSPDSAAQPSPDGMNSHALAVVFAPLLLGDSTELIDVDIREAPTTPAAHGSPGRKLLHYWKTPKPMKRSRKEECSPVMAASLDKYKIAVTVTEMLVRDWEAINQQMKQHTALPKRSARLFSDNPDSLRDTSLNNLDGCRDHIRPNSRPAATPLARSDSLLKSASQPVLSYTLGNDDKFTQSNREFRPSQLSRSVSEYLQPVHQTSTTPSVSISPLDTVGKSSSLAALPRQEDLREGLDPFQDVLSHRKESSSDSVIMVPPLHNGSFSYWLDEQIGEGNEGYNMDAPTKIPGLKLDAIGDWAAVNFIRTNSAAAPCTNESSTVSKEMTRTPKSAINKTAQMNTPGSATPRPQKSQTRSQSSSKSASFIPRPVPGHGRHHVERSSPGAVALEQQRSPVSRATRLGHRNTIQSPPSSIPGAAAHGLHGGRDTNQLMAKSKLRIANTGRDLASELHVPKLASGRENSDEWGGNHIVPEHGRYEGAYSSESSPRSGNGTTSSSNPVSDKSPILQAANQPAIALYQENRRLNGIIFRQREQLLQVRQELAAIRQCRDAATVERLRETERQLEHCKRELAHFRKLVYRGSSDA